MHLFLLTGCWLLLTLPGRDTDTSVDTGWWTDADADTDADGDTDKDYFEPYVWGMDFESGWDGDDLAPFGIGGDIYQDPYMELTLYEERWFETQSDAYKCVSLFQVDMTRDDDLGYPGQMWWGAEIELTWLEGASLDECSNLNPQVWGEEVPRKVMESRRMGVGLAPLSTNMEEALRDAVNSGGGNWVVDYEPYILGFYIADASAGNFYGTELGWGYFTYLDDSGSILYGDDGNPVSYEVDGLGGTPAPAMLQGYSYYLQYVEGSLLP